MAWLPSAQPTSNEERGGAAKIGMLCGCRGEMVPVEKSWIKHGVYILYSFILDL